MKDFFLERPGLAIAIIVGFFVILLVEPWNRFRPAAQQFQSEIEPQTRAPARVEAINKIRYQDPVRALAQLEEILARPANAKEGEATRALLPEVIGLTFHKQIRENQLEAARKTWERLTREFPNDRATDQARMAWGQALERQQIPLERQDEICLCAGAARLGLCR